MKWKNATLASLAAVLLVLSACGAKEEGPRISDLTGKPAAEETTQTAQEPAEAEPEQKLETDKGSSVKIEKNETAKDDEAEKQAQLEALLAAYEAILDRSAEVLSSGGDIESGDGEMGLLEACYSGTGVGYAVEDLTGDGVPELVLGSLEEDTLYAVYTGDQGEPVLMLEGYYRHPCRYLGGGRFFCSGSASALNSILATYTLSEDGRELTCEDFFFTDESPEDMMSVAFFHNTSGVMDPDVSEQLDMDYDGFFAMEDQWMAQVRTIELTPFEVEYGKATSVIVDGPQVRAMWAGGEWNGDYDWIDLSTGEPVSTILFLADSTVTDFQISSLFLESVDDYGNLDFSVTPLYTQDVLTPDWALAVDLTFYGDLPSYGISYVDANRQLWRFYIEISGYDGSLVLTEY
ncbi:MAG: hypothetical protein ACI4PT_09510 [Candidatus Avoscillospira sp.]